MNKSNNPISQMNIYFESSVKLEVYWNYCAKAQFLLFSTIFCYLLLDSHVKKGPDFFFEISGVQDKRSQDN